MDQPPILFALISLFSIYDLIKNCTNLLLLKLQKNVATNLENFGDRIDKICKQPVIFSQAGPRLREALGRKYDGGVSVWICACLVIIFFFGID
jgi:hypothetical protein